MLNFFKKSGRSSSCDEKSLDKNKRNSMPSSSLSSDILIDEDFVYDENELIESRSRLSMNLEEILNDRNCLSYFIQYLEIKNALSLIKFYLDTESFKTATENEYRTKSKSMTQSEEYLSNVCDNHDIRSQCDGSDGISFSSSIFDVTDVVSLESNTDDKQNLFNSKFSSRSLNKVEDINSVPELRTLCDMRKPLTDDEKSQIYAETNKRKLEISNSVGCKMTESKTLDSIPKRTSIGTDAIRIYRKYLISSSQYFIDIPTLIHSQISLALCSQAQDDSDLNSQSFAISSNCFDEAQKYILQRLESKYLNDFLQHPFYCKYCFETLSSPKLKLVDILHSESALFYFMEYLEQENRRNCLEFWIAAWNFRKHYETMDMNVDPTKKEAQNDSMILYEKYFSLQAVCPLRISNNVRSHVEESICSDNEGRSISRCFDLPLKIIEKYIEDKYFKDFLSSQLFINYLNELKSKIQDRHSGDENKSYRIKGHRKTRSDCSHENTKNLRNRYISQQNTLLAMESSNLNPKIKKNSNINNGSSDMQIDSRQLTNPDLLWHRNSTGGLTFGRVDSMGRYERDFDIGTTEGKWTFSAGGNKLKNAVRKLVNLPEDRVQEEIAWQVAEMIVNDVTSITLKSKNPP